MSETANIDRLVRIIQGLMNKTVENGASEQEAAIAAEKVQTLLEDYNLDMDQIATSKSDTRGKQAHTAAAMYKYQRELMKRIAEMNFCMHWLDETNAMSFGKMRTVKRHILLGRKANVVGTTLMYDYLVSTMDRLLPYTGMEKRGKAALLWLEGCSDRLQVRLVEARREREAEAARRATEEATRARHPGAAPSTGTALTIVDVMQNETDLNWDAHMGFEPGTTTRARLEHVAKMAVYRAEREAKEAAAVVVELALVASGMSQSDAWHVARGYDVPKPVETKPETDAQRRKRKEREERAYRNSYRPDPRAVRRSTAEYQAGSGVGDTISLNQQVKHNSTGRIG